MSLLDFLRKSCLLMTLFFLTLNQWTVSAQSPAGDAGFPSEEQTQIVTDKIQVRFELPETAAAYDLVRRFFATAVKAGDLEVCEQILDKAAYYINDVDPDGYTQLYYAACSGQAELCRMMLQRGANPNFINQAKSDSLTPFEAAVINNHTETSKSILACLNPNNLAAVRGKNPLPLFLAIQNRNQEIVSALIDQGADVCLPGEFNGVIHVPLYFAACLDDVAMCRILVDAGAELEGRYDPNVNISDILFVAALSQSEELCDFLFERKFDPNTLNPQQRNVLQELLRNRKPLVYHKNINAFEMKRMPFTVTGPCSHVIQPAIARNRQEPVALPQPISLPASQGTQAGKSKTVGFCRMFLDHGTDVNYRDPSGCSVLDTLFLTQMEPLSPFTDFETLLAMFLEDGVDINAQDKNGWSALNYLLFTMFMCHEIAQNDDADDLDDGEVEEEIDDDEIVTEPVSESKDDADAKSKFDDRRIALFTKLIEAGADVKQADKKGNTLLHYAASATGEAIQKGHFNIRLQYETGGANRNFCRKLMELLVENGASIATENNDGETPYDWARQGGPMKAQRGGMGGHGGMGGYGGGGGETEAATPRPAMQVPPATTMPSSGKSAVDMMMQFSK